MTFRHVAAIPWDVEQREQRRTHESPGACRGLHTVVVND
jgi:hypothetical protein